MSKKQEPALTDPAAHPALQIVGLAPRGVRPKDDARDPAVAHDAVLADDKSISGCTTD